jgi:hypothetical protein
MLLSRFPVVSVVAVPRPNRCLGCRYPAVSSNLRGVAVTPPT